MYYLPSVKLALKFALKVHGEQKRKDNAPYIWHPISVSLILARVRPDDSALIIAGILHDTVEDSSPPNKITLDDIREVFGDDVHDLVWSVTEEDKAESWEVRKAKSLEKVLKMNKRQALLKTADKLHNLSELAYAYEEGNTWYFSKFKRPMPVFVEKSVKVFNALNEIWPENPLLPELKESIDVLKKIQ